MKVAIVHDWLVTYAGAERVLEQMINCYPQADIFAVIDFIPAERRGFLAGKKVNTTWIQHLPLARTKYRSYLPLMPLSIEQFDLSGYDLVISSSHAVAKGVITGPDQVHICMCYSPMRYAWDLQHQYLTEAGIDKGIKSIFARWILHKMRIWDTRTANGVDEFIAISDFVRRRIQRTYRRTSRVIYPPVDVNAFTLQVNKEDFYVTVSRLVPYKRVPLIAEAFQRMPNKKLFIIGSGPEMDRVKELAAPNVTVLGHQPFEVMFDYVRRARAFVFAAEEDFGIVPVEAQACGTPVIAFGKGGAVETINAAPGPDRSGVFFFEQTVEALCAAVEEFESLEIMPQACRNNALLFSTERFQKQFSDFVNAVVKRVQHK
jgi:glycosyltransferase involved in cell wall biosynthesis